MREGRMLSGGRDSLLDRAPTGFDETVIGGIAAANATRTQHPSEGVIGGRMAWGSTVQHGDLLQSFKS
ncbi:MAG: hypothetical protein WA715_25250 [Candidatus Acidiferrum sp.]